jgi:hypothetical protein
VCYRPLLTYEAVATGENFPEAEEGGAQCTERTEATSDDGIGKIRPVPDGLLRKPHHTALSALNMDPPCPAASALFGAVLATTLSTS